MPSSTDGDARPDPSAPKPLQDRAAFRIAALLAVLAAAFLVARGCGSGGDVTKDEAVAIAKQHVEFEPECYQVRFLRSGIKSIPLWAVSLWTLNKAGGFKRIAVVQVNADTGAVVDVDENTTSPYTLPQCEAPA